MQASIRFALLLACCVPVTALATDADPATGTGADAAAEAPALAEVVVTATRREQSLSKVPIKRYGIVRR